MQGQPTPNRRPCGFPGCDKPLAKRGFCDGHYQQRRAGRTLVPLRPIRAKHSQTGCSIEDCPGAYYARGWCRTHYNRWRRWGDPLAHPKVKRETCTVEGCDEPHEGRGLCVGHYRQDYHRRNAERNNAACRRRYEADREHQLERIAAYYRANSERIRAQSHERYYRNLEHNRAVAAEWQRRNPDYGARWRKANPERWSLRNRENARRRRCPPGSGPVSFAAILERDGMVCHLCGGEIASIKDLHFDHEVPLSRGGQHVAENIKPSHGLGNRWKHNKLMEELRGDPPCLTV